jgi:hypothetical protein
MNHIPAHAHSEFPISVNFDGHSAADILPRGVARTDH